jgi:putative addiction module CopG family antidote
MQVILSPELELIVSRQLTNGKYQDPIAVIRAAMELLEQQEDKLGELQQAVRVG